MAFLDFVKAKSACLAVAMIFVLHTAFPEEPSTEAQTEVQAIEPNAEHQATENTEAQAVEPSAKHQVAENTEAQTEDQEVVKQPIESFLSLDLGWFLHGLMNNGVALGVNYELLMLDHFSIRGMVGAMFFDIDETGANSIGVTTSLYANWYPMSKTLDKFYAGLGLTGDFLTYFGSGKSITSSMDALFSVMPLVGWKQNIANIIVLDFYGGYSFLFFNTQHYASAGDYIRSGVQFGIRFKVLWRPRQKAD